MMRTSLPCPIKGSTINCGSNAIPRPAVHACAGGAREKLLVLNPEGSENWRARKNLCNPLDSSLKLNFAELSI
jgi:hypothetical protein